MRHNVYRPAGFSRTGKVSVDIMTNIIIEREASMERWQTALRRARKEGIQIRQLAGCGMWIATSSSDGDIAYEVTPWACECQAGQHGDPVCKHRAALLAKLGRLVVEPRMDATDRCPNCNGIGEHPGTVSMGDTWRYDHIVCDDCHGTGRVEADLAA